MDGFLLCLISFLGGMWAHRIIRARRRENNRNHGNNRINENISRDNINENDINDSIVATEKSQKIALEPETGSQIEKHKFGQIGKLDQMTRDLDKQLEESEKTNKQLSDMLEEAIRRNKEINKVDERTNDQFKNSDGAIRKGIEEYNKNLTKFRESVNDLSSAALQQYQ